MLKSRRLFFLPRLFAGFLAFVGSGAASAQDAQPTAWPEMHPRGVVRTPNWSDYTVYPHEARRRDQEGAVAGQVLVGADGTPTECRILQSSGYAELDAGTCTLMLKMRFDPARDDKGKRVPSSFARRFVWILGTARAYGSSAIDVQLDLQAGSLTGCKVLKASGVYSDWWSAMACSRLIDVGYYLGPHAATARKAVVAVRLNAGDQAPFLSAPWPAGRLVAEERLRFVINGKGDPSGCTPDVRRGFGERLLSNLSPCGHLLAPLWVKKAKGKTGRFETRSYILD